jgi:glycosyltransferase involved in cell wall biosynthesis
MKVTVLMPIYNAEKYICEAIDSLLVQTSSNWKLICIDDGSTDSSASIVENYCVKDKRIKLICQTNAGPAVARAKAIEIVDTEYISILDSDDAYASNYVELMLKRAEETNADSIVPDVEFGYGNTKKMPNIFTTNQLDINMEINDGRQAFALTIPWKLHGWQMIRTTLAKQYYTVEQASYSTFNSDEYITRLLYLKSKKTVLCPACYQYRIANDSITRTPSIKKLDYLKTLDKLVDLCRNEQIDIHIQIELYNDFYMTLINMWRLINQLPQKDRTLARNLVKTSYHNVYCAKFPKKIWRVAPLKTSIKFAISMIGFKTIKWMAQKS